MESPSNWLNQLSFIILPPIRDMYDFAHDLYPLEEERLPMVEASETPWSDGLTIGQVLRKTAEDFPDVVAIIFPGLSVQYTWAEFDREVDHVAKSLLAMGF